MYSTFAVKGRHGSLEEHAEKQHLGLREAMASVTLPQFWIEWSSAVSYGALLT